MACCQSAWSDFHPAVQPHAMYYILARVSYRKACPVDCYAGTDLDAINLPGWELYPDAPKILPLFHIHNSSLPLHNACSSHMLVKYMREAHQHWSAMTSALPNWLHHKDVLPVNRLHMCSFPRFLYRAGW